MGIFMPLRLHLLSGAPSGAIRREKHGVSKKTRQGKIVAGVI